MRARQSRRLSAHSFRSVDLLVLALLTWAVIEGVVPSPLLQSSVAEVVPPIVGALLLGRLMRSVGLYRFARSERLATHLARLSVAALVSGAAVVVVAACVRGDRWSVRATLAWTGLALVVLGLVHVLWSALVRHWRADVADAQPRRRGGHVPCGTTHS